MDPVSVATSTRCVAPSLRAYHRPSPRMSLPSASVLMTSTVFPSALFRMSPGLMARPPGHVLRRRHDADDADRRVQGGDGAHRAHDGRAAGHVVLHPLHPVGRLDRDAAGVERDALPHQPEDRARRRAGGLVADDHQPRRLVASARDAEQQAHAELLDGFLVEHLERQAVAGDDVADRRANSRGVSELPGSLQSAREGCCTRRATARAAPRRRRPTRGRQGRRRRQSSTPEPCPAAGRPSCTGRC